MAYTYYTLKRNSSLCHIFEFSPSEYRLDATIGKRGKLEPLSKINGEPTSGETVVAKLNGGFFNMNGSSEYIGTFVDDGLYYNPPESIYPTLVFWKDSNQLEVEVGIPNKTRLVTYQQKAQFAMGVPWTLVVNGKKDFTYPMNDLKKWFGHPMQRAPRTMIGQKHDGTIVWVAVDGRGKNGSLGMTSEHMAALMIELKCRVAVNLDGGGSTEMIVDGKIKNKPSDGRERYIGTALMCYGKKKTINAIPTIATGIVTCSSLRVRSAPVNGSVIGGLTKGQQVSIVGTNDNGQWYQIKYGSGTGWASAQYIKKNTSSSTADNSTYGVTTANLNMRTSYSTKNAVILCIPKGSRIKLITSSNGWYQTSYNGKTGWVCGDYVKPV